MDPYGDKYPSRLLTEAVDAIGSLPGVGRRSALRFALHLLKQPSENVHHFTQALNNLRDEAKYCSVCRMISDDEKCSICSDHSRDHRQVCVVENVRDVMSIEATGQYHGVYHVLGGIISPINGIGPSDLTVDALVERIEALSSGKLAMAGLDTLDHEPVQPDHPLLNVPDQIAEKLLFSPHIAGITASSFRRSFAMIAEDIQDAAEGRVPKRVVNPW